MSSKQLLTCFIIFLRLHFLLHSVRAQDVWTTPVRKPRRNPAYFVFRDQLSRLVSAMPAILRGRPSGKRRSIPDRDALYVCRHSRGTCPIDVDAGPPTAWKVRNGTMGLPTNVLNWEIMFPRCLDGINMYYSFDSCSSARDFRSRYLRRPEDLAADRWPFIAGDANDCRWNMDLPRSYVYDTVTVARVHMDDLLHLWGPEEIEKLCEEYPLNEKDSRGLRLPDWNAVARANPDRAGVALWTPVGRLVDFDLPTVFLWDGSVANRVSSRRSMLPWVPGKHGRPPCWV